MFILAPQDSFWWPITVETAAAEGGRFEKSTFQAKFKRLDQARLDEIAQQARRSEIRDQDLALEVLIGWKDVSDGDGRDVPFNEAARDRLLNQAGLRAALVTAFFEACNGGRRKN